MSNAISYFVVIAAPGPAAATAAALSLLDPDSRAHLARKGWGLTPVVNGQHLTGLKVFGSLPEAQQAISSWEYLGALCTLGSLVTPAPSSSPDGGGR